MSKTAGKYASILANICIIVFPLLFATNVYFCFSKENSLLGEIDEATKIVNMAHIEKSECSKSTTILNVSITIVLAALWNMKKAIKIGSI